MSDALREVITEFDRDRVLCHEVLFPHRHTNQTAPYQRDMINVWHSKSLWDLFMVFRQGAKSTIAEEAIFIKSLFREIRNYLIIGSTEDRACERLHAIRHEAEQNETIAEVFGDVRGPVWGDGELVFSNGVRLLALGRGQALRGVKHEDARPDGVFFDDVETRADVRTPEARKATWDWVITEVIPALDSNKAHGRCAATPLDPEGLPYQLVRAGWKPHVYPIEYRDEYDHRRPTWPDRFPLWKVDQIKQAFERTGSMREYNAEYMCTAESPGEKAFKAEMFRTNAVVRTWQNTQAMFDPARTTNRTSASTGYAAWSWIGPKLVVWDAWGKMLMPNEIVGEIFQCNEDHHPVAIGVEEDGLNEWLLQPIRQEQVKRGIAIPYKALRAPKGKLDFIRALQPFFNAREIEFAKDLPELKQQFLSFPNGRIDAPNALAYALKMRPDSPIYEDFSGRNVGEDMAATTGRPAWLCLNCTPNMVTAVLLQQIDGACRIYADWVREGDAGAVLEDIVKEAQTEAGRTVRLVASAQHFEKYTNFGLKQAAAKLGAELRRGVPVQMGKEIIRDLLKREIRGMPALVIDRSAIWTANAFAGGYARAMLKQGILADYAEEGAYRVLMEGIETFMGLSKTGSQDDVDDAIAWDALPNGRRFMTARR